MNIYNIIEELGKTDPELNEKLSRRDMFKGTSSFAKKVAIAAIPLAFASTIKKSYGGTKETVVEVLNYALTLEYLEDDFYQRGLAAISLIPADRRAIFQQISKHETAHVAFLKTTIAALGGTAVAKPTFDFTAKGAYTNTFTSYETFLTLSQAFEDTGVRAYKGRAAELQANKDVLTAALQIHSVEARHAAMIRRLRTEKGWITGNTSLSAPAAVYAGEDNVVQGGVTITTALNISAAIATQSFDEPLTKDATIAIITPFLP